MRGPGGRFLVRLEDASGLGEVDRFCFGRGEYPWMESRDRTVFAGVLAPGNRQNLEELLSVQWRIAQQTAVLVSRMVAADGRMEALGKFVSFKLADTPDGGREIQIGGRKLDAAVRLEKNRNVPASVTVRQGDYFIRVVFTCWESDSPYRPADFEPPSGGKVRNVDCRTLERIFASGMNFIIETGFDK